MHEEEKLEYVKILSEFKSIPFHWELRNNKIIHKFIKDYCNQPAEIFVALAKVKTQTIYINGIRNLPHLCYMLNLPYEICEIILIASLDIIHCDTLDEFVSYKIFCREMLLHIINIQPSKMAKEYKL